MTLLARMLGFGLPVVQALPRRARVGLPLGLVLLLTFGLWPELLMEVARLRVERLLEVVMESVQDVATGPQGRG